MPSSSSPFPKTVASPRPITRIVNSSGTSGTSPAAFTFTLPSQGIWDVTLSVQGTGSAFHRASWTGRIIWYGYNNDGTRRICVSGVIAKGACGQITDIALSDPVLATGVVTMTVTASVGGAQTYYWTIRLTPITTTTDEFNV